MTADDMENFESFCNKATNVQLEAIIEKERAAGHEDYAKIAEWVKTWREAPPTRYDHK